MKFFDSADERQLQERGLTINDALQQIHQFTHDTQPARLDRACTVGDGILSLSGSDCFAYQRIYETERVRKSLLKFVPASGAASRMFKHLYNYSADNVSELTEEFIINFRRFPFRSSLKQAMAEKGLDLDAMEADNKWNEIFDFMLMPHGLHYDDQLKGLVVFHAYQEEIRTAFDEHLHEAMGYAKQHDGSCRLHFTLAPHHIERVTAYFDQKLKQFDYDHFEISYSTQSSATDTLALTKDNAPFRDEHGQLMFRPSGHGALIRNLQQLDADVIFIKNIDNVTTQHQLDQTIVYKQVLAGLLLDLRNKINHLLEGLEQDKESALEEALEFIQAWFQPSLPLGMSREQLSQYATLKLDRPLRVCGMVRNEGEPGGGPFWVRMQGGYISKQIVEKSQVDLNDVQQSKILASSTHFNPVDIVCSIKNRAGENYQLDEFIDYTSGFISEKFAQGQVIKALEWPGLWNGAMALWNTVFVEVPVSTFNPVKTVNDLLRPGHQALGL
jgi:hypothetical protein